ncbi:hypothetical protein [Thiomonas sp.]
MSRTSARPGNPLRQPLLAAVLLTLAIPTAWAASAGTAIPLAASAPVQVQNLETGPSLPATVTPGRILTPGAAPAAVNPAPVPSPAAPASAAGTPAGLNGAPEVETTPAGRKLDQGLAQLGMKPVIPGDHPAVRPVRHEAPRPRWTPPRHARTRTVKPAVSVVPRGELVLSNTQLNILRFPVAIKHLWFPADTPVVGKPAYFADNHAVMVQFQPGVQSQVQLMVELANGSVLSKEAELRAGPGAVYDLGGHSGLIPGDSAPASEPAAPDSNGMAAVRLLQGVVQGRIPHGFDPAPLPAPTVFTAFTANPVMVWKDTTSNLAIYVFQLKAMGAPAKVAPPEFYRPGVEAVLLTSDTVTPADGPFLYVVEAFHGE